MIQTRIERINETFVMLVTLMKSLTKRLTEESSVMWIASRIHTLKLRMSRVMLIIKIMMMKQLQLMSDLSAKRTVRKPKKRILI